MALVHGHFYEVKREVIERPEKGGVMLRNCVAFVLALLGCDSTVCTS